MIIKKGDWHLTDTFGHAIEVGAQLYDRTGRLTTITSGVVPARRGFTGYVQTNRGLYPAKEFDLKWIWKGIGDPFDSQSQSARKR